MKKIFIVFAAVFCYSFLYGAGIVRNSAAESCVVIEKNAQPPIRLAAAEISAYAGKITGTALQIKNKADKTLYPIYLRIEKDTSLGSEGFSIRSSADSLVISGNTPRAVLYGAYAFIEEFFGVRWFAPGELYEHCPNRKTLVIPDQINIRKVPQFAVRNIGFIGSIWNSDLSESWKFLARSRWQIKANLRCSQFAEKYAELDAVYSGGGHILARLVPDTLFDTHPEYFALVGGKRIRQTENGRAKSQPCTTHPGVIALAVKGVIEYFDKAPPNSIYLIGNNDVQVWCECPSCKALDTPEDRKKGYVSTRFFTFINQVAEGVRKKHPQADIRAWAYQNFRFAPEKVKTDPALRVNLCDHQRCYRHSLADMSCRQNAVFRDMFASWRSRKIPLTERGYQEVLLHNAYFYLPIENVIADDLRYLYKIGADGYEYTVNPPDGRYPKRYGSQNTEYRKNAMYCLWPSIYICGKMLWDTGSDPEEIWEDAGKHFYGKAWPVMKEYRTLLQKAYTETSGHIIYGNPAVDIGKCLQKPGVKKQLLDFWRKAEKLAAADSDKKVAKRLAAEKKYFIETWLKNADEFEKTLSRTSSAVKTAENIRTDGALQEKIWDKAQYIVGFANEVEPPAVPADIFMKVLYDKEFLYLGIVGTNPIAGEKWMLILPDHADLNSDAKIFELNRQAPFAKNSRKQDGKIYHELKIPRKLINLSDNAAAFFVNVKRVQFSKVCGELYRSSFGGVSLGAQGIINGNFADVQQVSRKQKKISSKTFPVKWGFSGRNAEFLNEKVTLTGSLYQYMQVSGGKNGGILKVDIAAAAEEGKKGYLRPYLSLQRSLEKGRFRHEIKKYSKRISLNDRKIYRFRFELLPNEKGYIYINGTNAVIENIAAAFIPSE